MRVKFRSTIIVLSTCIIGACGTTEPGTPANTGRIISGAISSTPPSNSTIGVVVTIDGLRSRPTDSTSQYSFDSVSAGSHVIRPEKNGFVFSPATRSVTVVDTDIPNVDFVQTSTALPSDSIVMVRIEPGTFLMGCDATDYECFERSRPKHRVTISQPYFIGITEVTQAQWVKVMGWNNSEVKGENHPVTEISYDSITVYCNRLSVLHGLQPGYSGFGKNTVINRNANGYRLPTEAEWEYAASAGSTSAITGLPDPVSGSDIEAYYREVEKVAWFRGSQPGAIGVGP